LVNRPRDLGQHARPLHEFPLCLSALHRVRILRVIGRRTES
jgi:hypothetical protein